LWYSDIMSRRRRIEVQTKEEKQHKKEEQIDAQWSIKRVIIFLTIVGIGILLLYMFVESRVGKVLGEQDARENISPQIELLKGDDVERIIQDAEQSVSNIDAQNIIASQPQIQRAIEQLEKLTNEDHFRDVFCSSVCGK